jgi:hypothetical protein
MNSRIFATAFVNGLDEVDGIFAGQALLFR